MKDVYNLLLDFHSEIENLLQLGEGVNGIKRNSIHRPPYQINIFDKYKADETDTSWVLFEILKYMDKGEYIVLKQFISHYLQPLG